MVVSEQMQFMQNKSLGYDKEQVIVVERAFALNDKTQTFIDEVKSIPGVEHAASQQPARMFREEFAARGLAPQVLSRAVEDSGTVTSVLVPWNTCGAYIAGVLGVSTASYFPYCFFNLLSPLLDVLYGYKTLRPQLAARLHNN